MKIGANQNLTATGMVTKKNLKEMDKGPSEKVELGGNTGDEALVMGDKLKDMKSFMDSSTFMKIIALQAGCMLGGAGIGGFAGYVALSALGGPVVGAIGAVAGVIGGGAAGHALSIHLT